MPETRARRRFPPTVIPLCAALLALALLSGCAAPRRHAPFTRTVGPVQVYRHAIATELRAADPELARDELLRRGRATPGRLRVVGRDRYKGQSGAVALIRFDVRPARTAAGSDSPLEVHQALLHLHTRGHARAAALYPLREDWDPSATWNRVGEVGRVGSSGGATIPATRRGKSRRDVLEFDVTESVRAWLAGVPNHGWALFASDGERWELFGPDAEDESLRPELLVLSSVPAPRLAIGAGDVTASGVVLWALPTQPGAVRFELSDDDDFATVRLTRTCEQEAAPVPVKCELSGLQPGRDYYYRATDVAGAVAVGQFRTPAASGARRGLRFGASGDVDGRLRPFPSLSNVPQRGLDFFVLLGDTILADDASQPEFEGPARSLDEFRGKHAEILQPSYGLSYASALRASTALFATIDDHEVVDNFAGAAATESDPRFTNGSRPSVNRTRRFEAGLRAFQEYHPLRDEFYAPESEARFAGRRRLFRERRFGDDAALFLLDARSFRDAPIPNVFEIEHERWFKRAFTPGRTLLGATQLQQLQAGLTEAQRAGVTWKFVCIPEPIQNLTPVSGEDRYEGYAAERTALLRFIERERIENVVFIAADVHGTLVNNLTYRTRPEGRQHKVAAWEITTGPIAFAPPFGPEAVREVRRHERFWGKVLEKVYHLRDRRGHDTLLRWLIDQAFILWRFDPLGLDHSPLSARRISGEWVSLHAYGWTEFEMDAATRRLRVRVWGIDWYDEETLRRTPIDVLTRQPEVLTEFEVAPAKPD